jgi:hypothetical protein
MDRVGGSTLSMLSRLLVLVLVAAIMPSTATALGSSSFTFAPDPTQPALPMGSKLVGVGDVTGSGVADLLLVNAEDDAVGVMLGNGAGAFASPSWFPVAGHPAFVSVADFNGDGHPDLVTASQTATSVWLDEPATTATVQPGISLVRATPPRVLSAS